MLLILFVLVVLVVGALTLQAAATSADSRRFPPPGRLIDIGGSRLHLLDTGSGSPTVVLESGISASCLNWTEIHNRIAQFTRCCSYDRASLGWSDPASRPRLLSQIVEELHTLLDAGGIPPPYVLVGHSFGGLVVRGYANKYVDEVRGLVLVDPLSASEWVQPSEAQSRRLGRGVRLARRGALLARLGIIRVSLALLSGGARRIPRIIARLTSGRGESTVSRIAGEVRKMPPETWPMIRAHWCQPKSFLGMSAYLESLPLSCAEAAGLPNSSHIPITILSAAGSPAAQLAEREALARASPQGKHVIAARSGHWIHLDEPGLVIQAIREMVEWPHSV